jgi:hypothetical protein
MPRLLTPKQLHEIKLVRSNGFWAIVTYFAPTILRSPNRDHFIYQTDCIEMKLYGDLVSKLWEDPNIRIQKWYQALLQSSTFLEHAQNLPHQPIQLKRRRHDT